MSSFIWQARVYWEDTDAGGIVYHANYLRFLERARTEWLRARGISQRGLAADPGIVFSVVALQVQYLRSARLDDLLEISCEPRQQGGATLEFSQGIWRVGEEAQVLLSASVRVACLDAHSMKPRRLPPVIVQNLIA
ncbi:MAG: tol-pal system-associated acyl-CoA thioesterase [Steroidobacteraceae bacterium]